MFKSLIQKIRQVMYKMGLIKGLKSLSQLKDIDINEDMLQKIEVWKALYKGYYEGTSQEPFHKINIQTMAGKKTRRMLSMNMPKAISQEMASLIFNEKCEINIDNKAVEDFMEGIFQDNKFNKNFQDYLEFMFAMGGMVIKPYHDNGKIKLSYVTADCFFPISWDNKGVYEAVFPNEFKRRGKWYTLLEWHLCEGNQYVIRNELFQSENKSELGIKVPLSTIYEDLEEEIYFKNIDRSLMAYFKPNIANNFDTHSPLGISLYANSLDTLRTIDTMFDSFNREFRLGKKRIIVPHYMIKSVIDPETGDTYRYFDANDETYEAFKFSHEKEDVKDINVELRVEEHINAINAMLNYLAIQTGFSPGTFTFDGQSMKTATEVVSENSKTFKSKQSHETIIEAGLQELVAVCVQLGMAFDLISDPGEYTVTVKFDDSIAEDKNAEINKQIQMINAKMQSRKRAIMKVHGLTEKEAEELLQEINEENATATAESLNFFGGRGD